MTELDKLSQDSLHFGLKRMNDRVLYAAVMGIGLFCGIFYLAPNDFIHDWRFHFYLAGLVEVTSVSVLWKFHGDWAIRLLPRGLFFRCIFIFHTALFALCCSLGIRILLTELPMGNFNIQATSTLLWGCTVAVSTFAFDLVACFGYLIFMLVPIIYTSAFQLPDSQGLTITYVVSLIFFLYLGRSIHRSEIDVLSKEEKLTLQGRDLESSNDALAASNTLFHDTLNGIDEIFLLFGLDGICYADPTNRGSEVLGYDPMNREFAEVLGLEKAPKENAAGFFRLFVKGAISFETFVSSVPAERLHVNREATYRLRYFAKKKDGALFGVIVTLADVTKQMRAEQAARAASERVKFILAVNENRADFIRFIADVEDLFTQIKHWRGSPFKEMRLRIHTVKGVAALFEMSQLASEIHKFELKIKSLTADDPMSIEIINRGASEVLEMFRSLLSTERRLLERLRIIGVRETTMSDDHVALIQNLFSDGITDASSYGQMIGYLRAPSLNVLLNAYSRQVESLGKKLRKKVLLQRTETSFDALILSEKAFQALSSLVHLFNNAVDHGIEDATARLLAKKPEVGAILISTYIKSGKITIKVEDDGAGLNPAALRSAMQKKGLSTEGKSDADILRVIFDAGFSTKDQVTTVSGHGVGLSALYETVCSLGGTVEVASVVGSGTTFEIILPISDDHVKVITLPKVSTDKLEIAS